MPKDASETRARIVAAASRLFYGQGLGVSVDDVAAEAGVTKRTLYYHFRSKDDLIAVYLAVRDEPTVGIVMGWMDAVDGPLAAKLETVFAQLARLARLPNWRGCGFLRTAAELAAMPGHPAIKVGAKHKTAVEAWLASVIAADGRKKAAELARQIVILMDGAFSTMLIHRDPLYIEAAGRAAAALVGARK